jgi:hypothetical protein
MLILHYCCLCFFHDFTYLLYGPGQMPVRTMFPRFYTLQDFTPVKWYPQKRKIRVLLYIVPQIWDLKLSQDVLYKFTAKNPLFNNICVKRWLGCNVSKRPKLWFGPLPGKGYYNTNLSQTQWHNMERITTLNWINLRNKTKNSEYESLVKVKQNEKQDHMQIEWMILKDCIQESAAKIIGTETWNTQIEWWNEECMKATEGINNSQKKCLQTTRRSAEYCTLKRKKPNPICRKKNV